MYILKFLAVMLSMILADMCWAFYISNVSKEKSIRAGMWSGLILVFGAFTAINYIHDNTLLLAAIIGAFLGTIISVEYNKRNNKK